MRALGQSVTACRSLCLGETHGTMAV